MKVKVTTHIAFALAVALAAGAAVAQAPPGSGFGPGRGPMEQSLGPLSGRGRFWQNPQIVDALKLTDDQRKAMDDILQQHLESLVDLRANAQARSALFKANAQFLLALREKLSPEQWKQVQAFRDAHPGASHRWRQGGPGPQGAAPPPAGPQ
jgi:periplasmic protein CpxP/Spy